MNKLFIIDAKRKGSNFDQQKHDEHQIQCKYQWDRICSKFRYLYDINRHSSFR